MKPDNILNKILVQKEIEILKLRLEKDNIIAKAKANIKKSNFISILNDHFLSNNNIPTIIAEIKPASPSLGIIRNDFNLDEISNNYSNQKSVAAISVLTDKKFFNAGYQNLIKVSKQTNKPLLRKDFIIDEIQVYESKAINAQAILLIMSALNIEQAVKLESLAHNLNIDVLVEVHNEVELELALTNLSTKLIGINNRDLINFTTDIELSLRLINKIPNDYFVVSESGINSSQQISKLTKAGIKGFLIGEFFMKQANINDGFNKLLK